jgi:cytochrome c2
MTKLSVVFAIIGLVFLVLSALPGQPATSVAQAPPATSAPTAGASGASSESDIAYGKALFSAKGCATCHRHAAVSSSGFGLESGIPDLTTYRWSADYLRTWLKDPAAVKPATEMPNLGLKRDEIEALIAFLSTSK